jgi:hypothetical protein
MKIVVCIALFVFSFGVARGQGLLSIGPEMQTEGEWPWTLSISSQIGWDSNPFATPSNSTTAPVPSSSPSAPPAAAEKSSSSQGTGTLQGDVSLTYATGGRSNHFNLAADYSALLYAKVPPGSQDFSNNWKVSADYSRKESELVSISDSLYLAHQTQPDFAVGLTLNRPTNGSFVAYNNLSLSYSLSRVLSLVTSYTLTGVRYDDQAFQSEDYVEHIIGEQLRYMMTRRTTGTLSLRYEISDYSHMPTTSSNTEFVLLGMDHQFSRWLQGTISAGMEFRKYNGPLGSVTAPDVEASLSYRMGKNTTWRWYASLGLNDTGSAGTQSGYSYQTGLSLSQQLAPRLTMSISLSGGWTDYSRGFAPQVPVAPIPGIPVSAAQPDQIQATYGASLNFSYQLYKNVSLTASYSYTDVTGQSALVAAYDRQQVTLGLSASF